MTYTVILWKMVRTITEGNSADTLAKVSTILSPSSTMALTQKTIHMAGGTGIMLLEMVSSEADMTMISHGHEAKKNERLCILFSRPSWISTQAMVQCMA